MFGGIGFVEFCGNIDCCLIINLWKLWRIVWIEFRLDVDVFIENFFFKWL